MQRSRNFLDPVLLIPALQELLKTSYFLIGEQFIEFITFSLSASIDKPENLPMPQCSCNAKQSCHLIFTDEKPTVDIVFKVPHPRDIITSPLMSLLVPLTTTSVITFAVYLGGGLLGFS